ncbi:MAG TPA: carboxypeptidase regulatory-like domain-containing protein [Vicinamibacterales bacterium]|nr:carboxypeptidase regulatory-like domain-containing protein [Vicinamibacterales bacterium]
MKRIAAMTALLVLVISGTGFGQGVQTGLIRGVVKDAQGLLVPGVTVTATSPSLQGPRVAVTDGEGAFSLAALPAGDYTMTFELSGFATVARKAAVPVGSTAVENVTLAAAGVAESISVVGQTPPVITSPVVGGDFRHDEIESLATPRTIQGIAQLAPAVNENGPNAQTVVINGAFSFDNVFMVNGVDINDNLFAQPQNLFVEDAIEETQVLTSGISAEYGRFSGGVVNAITKSGGNNFSGSGRINFLNPSWTTETPFEVSRGTTHLDVLSRTYEGTFGGPIAKDRLWFFTSGRYADTSNQVTLQLTGIGLTSVDTNKRGEVKLTGTVAPNHTVQGGYLTDPRTRTNNSGLQTFIIEPHSEVDRSNPNWYYYTNYRGVVRGNLLVEAQYSERRFQFEGDGGTSRNIVDSPFLSVTQCSCLYNAPYFDATDPEHRNNRQITGSVTDYWTLHGRHETKAGVEWFRSQRTGGNSQSSTSYVFNADFVADASGTPLLDPNGYAIPQFVSGLSSVDFFPATRGGTMNIDNSSAFVQDHWAVNGHWSVDLGARFEHVKALSTPGDIVSIDSNRIVPRLAAAYDVRGNGNHVVHVTYGQYSGRYNEAQIGANSVVGNPPDINFTYTGPSGQGRDFAPGFNLANYPLDTAFVFNAPLANTFMDPGLTSPLTHEVSASYGVNLRNGRGYAEGSFVFRKTRDFIEDFQTTAQGTSHVFVSITDPAAGGPSSDPNAPAFTNRLYSNTNLAHREYDAVVLQSRYRLTNNWSINGHYTLQLKNDGNYQGEGSNTPGSTVFSNSPSIIGNFPEAFSADRNYPDGRLPTFERNRLRVWSVYVWNMGRAGDLSLSGLWRVDSALSYSLAARNQSLTQAQVAIMTAAGYPDAANLAALGPISGNAVFFGPLGSEQFAGYGLLDTSINYNVPVFRTLRPWVKLDIYNLFDNQKLIAWNTTVRQDPNSTRDALGLRTGYVPTNPASFGTATGNTVSNLFTSAINAFPLAFTTAPAGGRTFRVAVGVRF